MQELLARLKKADPGTYGEWISMDGVFPQEGYELSDTELDCLQGTIQRAIEAKGWFMLIRWEPYLKKWSAYILIRDMIRVDGDGDSPAMAILSAYLQALEANDVQPR